LGTERPFHAALLDVTLEWEYITTQVAERESDGFIVVMKSGNADGAKEPWQYQTGGNSVVEQCKKERDPIAGKT
jgi:hypothetical protein